MLDSCTLRNGNGEDNETNKIERACWGRRRRTLLGEGNDE